MSFAGGQCSARALAGGLSGYLLSVKGCAVWEFFVVVGVFLLPFTMKTLLSMLWSLKVELHPI